MGYTHKINYLERLILTKFRLTRKKKLKTKVEICFMK